MRKRSSTIQKAAISSYYPTDNSNLVSPQKTKTPVLMDRDRLNTIGGPSQKNKPVDPQDPLYYSSRRDPQDSTAIDAAITSMAPAHAIVPSDARLIDEFIYNPLFGQPQPTDYYFLYDWVLKSPELYGIIQGIADDVIGEGYKFVGEDSQIEAAELFAYENQFSDKFRAMITDAFLTGDGYLGLGALSKMQTTEITRGVLKELDLFKLDGFNENRFISKFMQEYPERFALQKIFVLKSATITIDANEHGEVKGFVQHTKTNPNIIEFYPDEIIHFRINPIGDTLYGRSPTLACLSDSLVLFYAKRYALKYFENNAVPDFIVNMPSESPNSQNVKNIITQFQRMRNNAHKTLITTGEVTVDKINAINKDLEFPTLIEKFTERLYLAWGIPFSLSSKETGRNIESSERYFKKINLWQQQLEELFNYRLWKRFGVKMKFNRVYKRDESREADIVTKLVGRIMTVNECREYLGKEPMEGNENDELDGPELAVDPMTGKPVGGKPGKPGAKGKPSNVEAGDKRTAQNEEKPTSAQNFQENKTSAKDEGKENQKLDKFDDVHLKHENDSDDKFDAEQLKMGIEVEKEHTNSIEVAKAIAKAHLAEDSKYYTKLKQMEARK